jgi:hypothetical protein
VFLIASLFSLLKSFPFFISRRKLLGCISILSHRVPFFQGTVLLMDHSEKIGTVLLKWLLESPGSDLGF